MIKKKFVLLAVRIENIECVFFVVFRRVCVCVFGFPAGSDKIYFNMTILQQLSSRQKVVVFHRCRAHYADYTGA